MKLMIHQVVLGLLSRFFQDLFVFFGNDQGDIFSFPFSFPFPQVLMPLISLFYVITNPEFDLHVFYRILH
jgi:hypothetical protein